MNPKLHRRPGTLSAPLQDLLLMCALICAMLIAGFSLAGCDEPATSGSVAPDAQTALAAQAGSQQTEAVEAPQPTLDTEPTTTPIDSPTWAGVPLKEIERLGLRGLALNDYENEWRAGLTEGGLVRLYTYDTVTAAKEAFRFHAVAASSIWTDRPAVSTLPGEEATGDGEGLLVLRDRNIVLYIQSPNGDAQAIGERLLAALVETHPDAVYEERQVGDQTVRWDGVGRRTVVDRR